MLLTRAHAGQERVPWLAHGAIAAGDAHSALALARHVVAHMVQWPMGMTVTRMALTSSSPGVSVEARRTGLTVEAGVADGARITDKADNKFII